LLLYLIIHFTYGQNIAAGSVRNKKFLFKEEIERAIETLPESSVVRGNILNPNNAIVTQR
jgi:uncharacterized protein YkwD